MTAPLRIAQIMAGAPMGGAEGFYERLSIALHGAGDTVLPVVRRDAGRAARLEAAGLRPVQLPFGGPLDLYTRPALRWRLRGFRPDVAVAWMNRGAAKTPRGGWPLVGRLGGYYDLKYYRHCDHLVGNTRELAGWIAAQGWPAERTHYLPNFVADMGGAMPAALDLPASVPVLLGLGRLHRNKGFDTALRALALLPGAILLLAGEGPERAALTALAAELGVTDRVRFLGWRQDAAALLAACDIFLCSSRHEPLGNMVIEAWSASRPVVAAASQGPSELIRDGVSGLLVPKEEPAAMAEALRALLADSARRSALGAAGRAAYAADFAQAPVLARWRGFLQQVAMTPRDRSAELPPGLSPGHSPGHSGTQPSPAAGR